VEFGHKNTPRELTQGVFDLLGVIADIAQYSHLTGETGEEETHKKKRH